MPGTCQLGLVGASCKCKWEEGTSKGNGSVRTSDCGEACTTVYTYTETHYTVYLKSVSCTVYKSYLKKAFKTKRLYKYS